MSMSKTDNTPQTNTNQALITHQIEFKTDTQGRGFTDITAPIENWIYNIGAEGGLLTVFIRHTSASLTIQENADPAVLYDLEQALHNIAPEDYPYRHSQEGPDDMPAHIKSVLTATSLSVPILDGKTALGTWQGIFLIEHRAKPHQRKFVLQFIGTTNNSI